MDRTDPSDTSLDETIVASDRWIKYAWASGSSGPAAIDDTQLFSMYFEISEKALDVAEEEGLELLTDENGKTYYLFPIRFAEQQMINLDFTGDYSDSSANPYMVPSRMYLNGDGIDISNTGVAYLDGGIRVYTDSLQQETTATTTEPPIVIQDPWDDTIKDINLDIQEVYVKPGEEGNIGVEVWAKDGIDPMCYAMSGVLSFPDVTAEMILLPAEDQSVMTLFGDGNQVNIRDFLAYKNGTSELTNGSDQWIRFALSNTMAPTDPTALDSILALTFEVPDADTVEEIAQAYGLELQTETEGSTVREYYTFPVEWAPDGIDYGLSIDTSVPLERFKYFSSSNYGNVYFRTMASLNMQRNDFRTTFCN